MRDGVLQQAGRPRELYARLVNLFVRASISTPCSSSLEGVVYAPRGAPNALGPERQCLRLPVPLTTDHPLLCVQQGRPVIVSPRPEAVRIGPPSQAVPRRAALAGIVGHVEHQGHEILVPARLHAVDHAGARIGPAPARCQGRSRDRGRMKTKGSVEQTKQLRNCLA